MYKSKEGDADDTTSLEMMEQVLEKGRRSLERIELPEAEASFCEVLKSLGTDKPSMHLSTMAAECLMGLGEVYHRLSRLKEQHLTVWLQRMFQALLMYSEAKNLSRRAIDDVTTDSNEAGSNFRRQNSSYISENRNIQRDIDKDNLSFFRQILSRSDIQIDLIEKCLVNELKQNVMEHCFKAKRVSEGLKACMVRETGGLFDGTMKSKEHSISGTMMPEPGAIYPSIISQPFFDGTWLYAILNQCCVTRAEKVEEFVYESTTTCSDNHTDYSSSSSPEVQESERDLQSLLIQQTKCKINFPKVQDAIRRLVSQVSSDVWAKYDGVTRRVPRELIERRLASEIILRLSPGSEDNKNLTAAFQDAILFGKQSECLQFETLTDGSINNSETSEQSSEMNDRQVFEDDSVFYDDNDSEDENNYETFTVQVNHSAVHALDRPTDDDDCRHQSEDNIVSYYQNEDFHNIASCKNGSSTQHQKRLNKSEAKFSDCYASDVTRNVPTQRDTAMMTTYNNKIASSVCAHGDYNIDHKSDECWPRCSTDDNNKYCSLTSVSGIQHTQIITTNNRGGYLKTEEKSTKEKAYSKLKDGMDTRHERNVTDCLLPGVLTILKRSSEAVEKPNEDPRRPVLLDSFEEVSPLTEKDRSLEFIEGDKILVFETTKGENKSMNETKLHQTVGRTAVRLAEALNADGMVADACEIFKFSLGMFLDYPSEETESFRTVISELLLSIGKTKCKLGDTAGGLQLLDESVALYERRITSADSGNTSSERRDMYKISEMLYQQGCTILPDSYRQDLLMSRVMMLVKQVTLDADDVTYKSDDDDDSDDDEDENDDEDNYSICCLEAIDCYRKSLSFLERLKGGTNEDEEIPSLLAQLYIDVLSSLADCFVISGHLEQAMQLYERTLSLFEKSLGGSSTLLARNSHVLSMIGTLNFLSKNWVRAATMYETSHILRQHLKGIPEHPTLEMPWTLCMLSLSYFMLGHYHKCVVWSIRSFTLYVRLYRGRIMDVDSLGHWFIVQALYMLGYAYMTLRLDIKALSYLTLCRNMAMRSSDGKEDKRQVVSVLLALVDTYRALNDNINALKYYHQALEYSYTTGDRMMTSSIQIHMTNGHSCLGMKISCKEDPSYVEDVIKDDTVRLLHKLGVENTFISETDVDVADDCNCSQSFEGYQLEAGQSITDTSGVLTDISLTGSSHQNEVSFEEVLQRSPSIATPVGIQYANYKYQQENSAQVR